MNDLHHTNPEQTYVTQWESFQMVDKTTWGAALIYNFLITACNDVICNRLILGRMLLCCAPLHVSVLKARYLDTAAGSHDLNMTRTEGEINMKHLIQMRKIKKYNFYQKYLKGL